MSVLIQIDSNDYDNMLELTEGQYLYDNAHGVILNTTTQSPVYIHKNIFHTTPAWANFILVNPMTRVTIYDNNQTIPSLQYTGNTMILSNYHTKKGNRISFCVNIDKDSDVFIDNISYLVVEPIDKSCCKRNIKYANGTLKTQFISAEQHKYKYVDEPIIKGSISTFTYNPMLKLFEIIIAIMCLVTLFSGAFMCSVKYARAMFPPKSAEQDLANLL
jgi:hypothetical protein